MKPSKELQKILSTAAKEVERWPKWKRSLDSIREGGVMPTTTKGKKAALDALFKRRKNQPTQIDNSSLVAGSPMYYYCVSCGYQSDCLPECWDPRFTKPKKLCKECQALKEMGWLSV